MSLCAVQPVYVQPEDDHYQASKHVAVPYIENTLYSTNKYSCVRPVHTLHISYFIENKGNDEPYEYGDIFGPMCLECGVVRPRLRTLWVAVERLHKCDKAKRYPAPLFRGRLMTAVMLHSVSEFGRFHPPPPPLNSVKPSPLVY